MTGDRRKLLLIVTGAVVAVAVVGAFLVSILGGDDEERQAEGGEMALPLRLTAPLDLSGVIGVDGEPAQLPEADKDAVVATVLGYLKEATVTAVSRERPGEGETTTTKPGTRSVASYFTPVAAARLESDDVIVLTDDHLPFSDDGVDTTKATLALAGIVQDGRTEFVNATIDVVMLVKGDQDITVERRGDLVLRQVDGTWGIAGYQLTVERAFGDRTTTSEAAFG